MSDVLLVNSSPRGEESESLRIAETLLSTLVRERPATRVERLDLFEDPLPVFGPDAARAKMDVIEGSEVARERSDAWRQALAVADRVRAAELLIFTVPMWNAGISWALKHFIDTITQPGVAFAFDPEAGYSGLLGGRRAVAIYASTVYSPGVAPDFGVDFHSTYFEYWLSFIGIDDVDTIRLQPTYPTPDLEGRRETALDQARELGRRLGGREPVGAR